MTRQGDTLNLTRDNVYKIFPLHEIKKFYWLNQVTGSFQGKSIDTSSYINKFDGCYDMSTDGPDVVLINDKNDAITSHFVRYLPPLKRSVTYLNDMVKLTSDYDAMSKLSLRTRKRKLIRKGTPLWAIHDKYNTISHLSQLTIYCLDSDFRCFMKNDSNFIDKQQMQVYFVPYLDHPGRFGAVRRSDLRNLIVGLSGKFKRNQT